MKASCLGEKSPARRAKLSPVREPGPSASAIAHSSSALLGNGERAAHQGLGLGEAVGLLQQLGQVVEVWGDGGMIGPRLFSSMPRSREAARGLRVHPIVAFRVGTVHGLRPHAARPPRLRTIPDHPPQMSEQRRGCLATALEVQSECRGVRKLYFPMGLITARRSRHRSSPRPLVIQLRSRADRHHRLANVAASRMRATSARSGVGHVRAAQRA
jgi:hypothetical protein